MVPLFWNAVLALVWASLVGKITGANLAAGFALGFACLWTAWPSRPRPEYFRRLFRLGAFLGFYAWDVFVSSLEVALDVITPRHRSRPAILALPIDAASDLEITLLANLITMTPGSLALDLSEDRKVLYVHAMFVDDPGAYKRELKEGLERRLLDLMR